MNDIYSDIEDKHEKYVFVKKNKQPIEKDVDTVAEQIQKAELLKMEKEISEEWRKLNFVLFVIGLFSVLYFVFADNVFEDAVFLGFLIKVGFIVVIAFFSIIWNIIKLNRLMKRYNFKRRSYGIEFRNDKELNHLFKKHSYSAKYRDDKQMNHYLKREKYRKRRGYFDR